MQTLSTILEFACLGFHLWLNDVSLTFKALSESWPDVADRTCYAPHTTTNCCCCNSSYRISWRPFRGAAELYDTTAERVRDSACSKTEGYQPARFCNCTVSTKCTLRYITLH